MSDLLVRNARLVATLDGERNELPGGWVAITDGLIEAVGASTDPAPVAGEVLDATDCLVTPGLINSHHHLFQNLTRAYPAMTSKPLFGWLQTLYPLWRALDEEAVYASAFVGLAELALSGCTTSTTACTFASTSSSSPERSFPIFMTMSISSAHKRTKRRRTSLCTHSTSGGRPRRLPRSKKGT